MFCFYEKNKIMKAAAGLTETMANSIMTSQSVFKAFRTKNKNKVHNELLLALSKKRRIL